MFANRFTALIDSCALVGALHRNLLLSLAEAGLYRVRWSIQILDEAERAIAKIIEEKGDKDAASRAKHSREKMESAFPEAMVTGYEPMIAEVNELRDPNDRHVLAAALKARASVLVTENHKDFCDYPLKVWNIELKISDEFLADTIDLDTAVSVAAVRKMRDRLKKPEISPDNLLLQMEARGLILTVDMLRDHVASI